MIDLIFTECIELITSDGGKGAIVWFCRNGVWFSPSVMYVLQIYGSHFESQLEAVGCFFSCSFWSGFLKHNGKWWKEIYLFCWCLLGKGCTVYLVIVTYTVKSFYFETIIYVCYVIPKKGWDIMLYSWSVMAKTMAMWCGFQELLPMLFYYVMMCLLWFAIQEHLRDVIPHLRDNATK